MPRRRKTPHTDSNPRDVNANMQGNSPFPLQGLAGWHPREEGPPGWHHGEDRPPVRHPGEATPREFHLHPRGDESDSLKSVDAPRIRGAIKESMLPPNPNHFPRNPPGFDNSFPPNPSQFLMALARNPPGFDKSNSCHGVRTVFQEALEITSDRPFLPQRRAPPAGPTTADDSNTQETAEGGPSNKGKKKKPRSAKNAQPAHAESASSFEQESPPALRPGILGKRPSIMVEPPVPPPGGATNSKAATADNSSGPATTDLCSKLWKDLGLAMQKRERALRERERNLAQKNINKQALEEEIKQAAAMKNEVMEERRKLEEEAQRIREEKDAMERTSNDIAVQMAELKQVQKQIENDKAVILALKTELGARERCSQEECVEATVHIPRGAGKAEIDKPICNRSRQIVNFSSASGVTPSNRQIREPEMAMHTHALSRISPMANDRNLASVKTDPVSSDRDAAHENESRRNDVFSEDDMDDVPLATRLKKQRVEKTGEKSTPSEEKGHCADIHMKRNKVPIEIALQEDAPGLLEQLEERGLLEDMTVYQDVGMDDSLAVECSGSEFGVLAGVIGKLWGSTAGLGKDLLPLKGQAGSGNMPRYCLSCLLSLIEQTKSLRKRNWPVEWGWCRRLRAFLFVFEKHNRIVLERPEYGYATYFFELVQKLPVKWQVQRLIAVMSVATTGRAALLENRQLEVGLHLTNEEAAILEDYGWNPSSGLGSLLNFCERVVHDYNKGQEDLGNDWKQKIGKLLMDGYDHGSIVQSIPRKLQRVLGDNLSGIDSFPGPGMKAEPA